MTYKRAQTVDKENAAPNTGHCINAWCRPSYRFDIYDMSTLISLGRGVRCELWLMNIHDLTDVEIETGCVLLCGWSMIYERLTCSASDRCHQADTAHTHVHL